MAYWAGDEDIIGTVGPDTTEGRVFQVVALAVAVVAGFAGYLGWVPSAEAGIAIITSAGVAWLAERWL